VDVRAHIAALRKLGFRLAVDDLGAGFAGLTSFAQIEPEVVKFDMSLVRGLTDSSTRQKLIRSMSTLFREMGITSVAEGVETAAERDAVLAAGCDLIQGYLYAKPGKPFPTVSW
jgi:EAL domain-containing protein (putative c-di-GMP-specific phosphodiesterase class I)